ncbi:MAG: spore coat associated protein CotJA [Ruminococcaceae bacterium]|nr:spore coat associated protein CotJA [Oscillospiraceae bacterium]MBQ8303965.1 spore coat associated protein CotJA [Clostridia bacterium]
MAYVPLQFLKEEYEPTVAFKNGTLFPELNKPFMAGGMK